MTHQNQIHRERILRNRPDVLLFARRADQAYEDRGESDRLAKEAEAARVEAKRRRYLERQKAQKRLSDIVRVGSQVGATLETRREAELARRAFTELERAWDFEDREERSLVVGLAAGADAGAHAFEELRELCVQDPELFELGVPPRLKAEFAQGTESPAVKKSRVPPPAERLAEAKARVATLLAAFMGEQSEHTPQPSSEQPRRSLPSPGPRRPNLAEARRLLGISSSAALG